MTLSLAISPCPNDTFVFHALVHGLVPGAPPVDVTYADVDVTNNAAEDTSGCWSPDGKPARSTWSR